MALSRRTALAALGAAMGWVMAGRDKAEAQNSWTSYTARITASNDLSIRLGGDYGWKTITFTDGTDTVTFSAAELMAALKEEQK